MNRLATNFTQLKLLNTLTKQQQKINNNNNNLLSLHNTTITTTFASTPVSRLVSNYSRHVHKSYTPTQQQPQPQTSLLSTAVINAAVTITSTYPSHNLNKNNLLLLCRHFTTSSSPPPPQQPQPPPQNNNNTDPSKEQQPKKEEMTSAQQRVRKFTRDSGLLQMYSRITDRLKFVLTRHKPLTSDHMFAIFSWLLFGTGSLIILGTTTLVSLILWIVNTFEFSEWAAKRIGKYLTTNTGINITFEGARGEWKTGYIRLENVTVSRKPRSDEHLSSIQLSIKQIDIKLSILWMLEGKGIIQECLVSGVRGIIDRRTEGVYVGTNMIYPRKKKSPGDFVFNRLDVKDLLITFHKPDTTHRPMLISIFSLESSRFRKQWLLYDIFCSKNIVGKFDGSLFTYTVPQLQTMDPETLSKFEQRELKIDGMDIEHLSKNATGPLGWIKDGTFDIQLNLLLPKCPEHEILVDTESTAVDYGIIPLDRDPFKNLHLNVNVQLNHLFSVAPLYTPELSYLSNALAHPIVAYINSHSKHIPLQFDFSLNLRQFNGAWTLSQASFWEVLSDSVGRELANKVKETKNVTTLRHVAGELLTDLIGWVKPFIERNRQEYRALLEEQQAMSQRFQLNA
ncbi:hypothetical protein SAMD00019534_070930 [Acytostelium subglobosum LB1]|uniref:hypothetical protein n=1 Tax=Acytostelium subglobosum LB1 TaxID=1410327 RepID=UPI000644C85D|nr:hypothetical protein SAMD00019534_070930 [Acytostelium subglobosum LB1]GAM23918.1 hypothetical protein SAMD00019534_070930 [Acytostelium subglobosum LB1]|eukprot:XP_012752954.1 hypothetical protein SAMD00019534_070930 [Acytostelium subglobosum LB1]